MCRYEDEVEVKVGFSGQEQAGDWRHRDAGRSFLGLAAAACRQTRPLTSPPLHGLIQVLTTASTHAAAYLGASQLQSSSQPHSLFLHTIR